MKPVRDIRRENLASLVDHAGGQSALAALLEKDKNQIYQWLQPAGSRYARGISDTTAREFERALKRPPGWMDYEHPLNVAEPKARYLSQIQDMTAPTLQRATEGMREAAMLLGITFDPSKHLVYVRELYAIVERNAGTLPPAEFFDFVSHHTSALTGGIEGGEEAKTVEDAEKQPAFSTRRRRKR